ncbi:MAG: N-acetylmuramoyl-L-alanine amidase, family 2 [Frankiales bacterium]|nr:N-acetylmuramoyl-L-alanine amidase, family 2 [Frankiales bacterium]
MRRLLTFLLFVAALSTVLVALPTLTTATATPRPVPAGVERIPLAAVDAASLRTLGSLKVRPAYLSSARTTRPFSLMGVTWAPDSAVGDVEVLLRHRSSGRWSDWESVEADSDDAPDAGSPDTRGAFRLGTAPIWTGPSDGVQVRVNALSGAKPRDVRIELVDPGTSPADALVDGPRDQAHSEEPRPQIITRAQWGADESIRRGSPSYNSTVKVGFVHHTASSNDYTREQAAAMVRGIYAYHVKSNGWADIGYNYLVDRYGRAYEGRAGGLDRFVVGAHTGGFNTDSFAVSLLGDFSTVAPDTATVGMLTDVLAWKLGTAYRDPLAKAVLTSQGGGTSKYSAGQKATFDVVSGHRDAGNTSCPGATTYARMDTIRQQVAQKLGDGFVDPVFTGGREHPRGARGPLTATARTRGPLDWTATVEDADGAVLRTSSGRNDGGGPVSLSWDMTDADGLSVRPGTYVMRLSGAGDGDRALPYQARIVVKGVVCRGNPLERARCNAKKRTG